MLQYAVVGIVVLFGIVWTIIGVIWYSAARECNGTAPHLKRAMLAYLIMNTFFELFSCSLLFCYGYWVHQYSGLDELELEDERVTVTAAGHIIRAPRMPLLKTPLRPTTLLSEHPGTVTPSRARPPALPPLIGGSDSVRATHSPLPAMALPALPVRAGAPRAAAMQSLVRREAEADNDLKTEEAESVASRDSV